MVTARRHNLPIQLTSFVGRQREIDELLRLLASTRLLTLTGAGGSGKTRLALETAALAVGRHSDGVRLVELAALADDALVPRTMASVLDIAEQPGRELIDVLADALAFRDLLLVLDNCEHLITASAALVEHLLRTCPEVRILATSRERLNVAGETVWRIPSLSLPPAGASLHASRFKESESVDLYVQRAVCAKPDFQLTAENAPAVANVCQRLDGMPLAIELAAARMSTLSPQQIAARLDDRFHLLSGGTRGAPERQQTLRATLDWSYGLLSAREQRLFNRLSVFSGGWTLEAAEAIGAGDDTASDEVLDLLGALVDKSLVQARQDESGSARYSLLETLRQYTQEQLLADVEEAKTAGDRHAAFFLSLVEAIPYWQLLTGPNQHRLLAGLEREHDNFRAALRWLIEHRQVERAYRLAGELGRFWFLRGHLSEGRAWLVELLAQPDLRVSTRARARAMEAAGRLAWAQGDLEAASPLTHQSLELWRALEEPREEAYALYLLGFLAQRSGDPVQSRSWLEQALITSVAAPNPEVEGLSNYNLGELAFEEGDHARAQALASKALEIAMRTEHVALKSHTLCLLGEMSYEQGDYGAARALLEAGVAEARRIGPWWTVWALPRLVSVVAMHGDQSQAWASAVESLELSRHIGDRLGIARALDAFALLAGRQGRPERVLRLAAAALQLRQGIGTPRSRREQKALDTALAAARTSAGQAAAEASESQGRAMSLEQAVADALDTNGSSHGRRPPAASNDLTPREREVLRLLAHGLSNRQIAEELVLGERTVESHVGKILAKLGLDSRAQAAIWAVEQKIRTASP